MAYTAYRVLRAPVEKIEDLMDKAISDGWQPLGAPVLVAPDTNMLYQAIAKGSPDGGGGPVTIVVGDITDAGTVGKSVLLAEDQAEARTAIGVDALLADKASVQSLSDLESRVADLEGTP